MPATSPIHGDFREAPARYPMMPHRPDGSAQEAPAAIQGPGRNRVKVVVCFVDGQPIEAVVSAPSDVDLDRLLEVAGGNVIRLARDDELARLYPGSEPGAMPLFGPLYGQPVFVDVTLAREPVLVFSARTPTDAIGMRWADFAASVRPVVASFAVPPLDQL